MTYGPRLRWKWVAETCWEELGKAIVAPKMDEGPMRGDACSFGGSFVNGFFGQKVANLLLSLYAPYLPSPLLVCTRARLVQYC